MISDWKVCKLLDQPTVNATELQKVNKIAFSNAQAGKRPRFILALDLWNKTCAAESTTKFSNIKELIIKEVQLSTNENVTLLTYLCMVVDYFLEYGKWLGNEKAPNALLSISCVKLLSNEQQRQYSRCSIINDIREATFNNGCIPILMSRVNLETISEFGFVGTLEGIYEAFKCDAFEQQRLDIIKLFENVIESISSTNKLLEMLRSNQKLVIIGETLFICLCDNFWFKEDPELGIFYLEKGAKIINSPKLLFYACVLDNRLDRNLLNYENVLEGMPLSKCLDDFLYFLDELHKTNPGLALFISKKHRESSLEPTIQTALFSAEVRFLISAEDVQRLAVLIDEQASMQTIDTEKLLIPIWLAAEREHASKKFRRAFELYKVCNILLLRIEKSQLNIPSDEIYINLLELAIKLKRPNDVVAVMEQKPEVTSEIINFLHFKINSSIGNYQLAIINFKRFAGNTSLAIESLLHCTALPVEISCIALVLEMFPFIMVQDVEPNERKTVSKLIMNFLSVVARLPENDWSGFGEFLVNIAPHIIDDMVAESAEIAFKLIWNLGISNLQSHSFKNAYKLLLICHEIPYQLRDNSFTVALFVAGVCVLRTEYDQAIVDLLSQLLPLIEHLQDDLFSNYYVEFLIVTGQNEKLLQQPNTKLLSSNQLADFLAASSNLQMLEYFFECLLGKLGDSEVSDEERGLVENSIKHKLTTVLYQHPDVVYRWLSNQTFQTRISSETKEWAIILAYNYAQFLVDSAKLRQAMQWSELALAILGLLQASSPLLQQVKSFYISLIIRL